MVAETAVNIGCNHACRAGLVIEELQARASSDATAELSASASSYLEANPCKFVVEGNCRLVEFLIRKELGLSLDEARLEAIEKYYAGPERE